MVYNRFYQSHSFLKKEEKHIYHPVYDHLHDKQHILEAEYEKNEEKVKKLSFIKRALLYFSKKLPLKNKKNNTFNTLNDLSQKIQSIKKKKSTYFKDLESKNIHRGVFLHEIFHTLMNYEMGYESDYIIAKGYRRGGEHKSKDIMRGEKKELSYHGSQYSDILISAIRTIKLALAGVIGEGIWVNAPPLDMRKFYASYGSTEGDVRVAIYCSTIYIYLNKIKNAGIKDYNKTFNNDKSYLEMVKAEESLKAEDIAQEALDLLNQQCKEVYKELSLIIINSRDKIEELCDQLEKNMDASGKSEIKGDFINPILRKENFELPLPEFARKKIAEIVKEVKEKQESQGIKTESKYETVHPKNKDPEKIWKALQDYKQLDEAFETKPETLETPKMQRRKSIG